MTSNINIPLLKSLHQVGNRFIGFGDFFDELEHLTHHNDSSNNVPPYNIVDVSDDLVKIEVAVAGFEKDEISVVVEDGTLSIIGKKTEDPKDVSDASDVVGNVLDTPYRYKGISTRAFSKSFRLAEYWEVEDASFHNGILTVSIRENVPEERKPKRIEINTG